MNTINSIAASAFPTSATGHFDPNAPLLRVRGLQRDYPLPRTRPWGPRAQVQALRGVDLDITTGRSLGVVTAEESAALLLSAVVTLVAATLTGRRLASRRASLP